MIGSWRRRAGASGAVATLIVGLGLSALPSAASASGEKPAAATLDGFSLAAAVQSFTSTTHQKLLVDLNADEQTSTSSGSPVTSSSVSFSVAHKGGRESHFWNFQVKQGSVTYSPAKGKGSITTAAQLAPFAKVDLVLKATEKKKTTTCGTYTTVTQPVTVKGVVSFDTRSTGKHRWGKVGSKKKRTFSGKSAVTYETGTFDSCGGSGYVTPCQASVEWSAYRQGSGINETGVSGTFSGNGKSNPVLFAFRNVSLKKPKGATREDTLTARDKKMTFSMSGGKATVKVGAAGPISGSATLSSPKVGQSFGNPCGSAGKTETTTSWVVPFTNGKSPLTVHEQIEGSYRLKNIPYSDTGTTSIDRQTVT